MEKENNNQFEEGKEEEEMSRFEASPSEPTEVLRDLDKAFRKLEHPEEEEEKEEEVSEERPSTKDLAAELAAEVEATSQQPIPTPEPVEQQSQPEQKKPEDIFSDLTPSWEDVAAEAKAEEQTEPSPEEIIAREFATQEKTEEQAEPSPEETTTREFAEEVREEEKPEETVEEVEAAETEEETKDLPSETLTEEAEEREAPPEPVYEETPRVDASVVTEPSEEVTVKPVEVNMEEVRSTFEEVAPVEGVEQLPRGAKYRRISKEQLYQLVAELVRRYATAAMQQLAQRESQIKQLQETLAYHQQELEHLRSQEGTFKAKIEALQQQLSERDAKIVSLESEVTELKEQAERLGAFGEKWLEKEDEYIKRIRELEEESNRLRSALETSGSQLQQKIEQLEQQIAVYKGRIEELQRGFEYIGFVEEFDVGGGLLKAAELRTKLEDLTSGVGEATSKILPASVRERLEFITLKTREIEGKLNNYRDTYSGLVEKMENGEGTISVAVEIAVMAERIRGLTDQLLVVGQMLEMVEAFIR